MAEEVEGVCHNCQTVFTYDPATVPVVLTDAESGSFVREGGAQPARVKRQPVCDSCVVLVRMIRVRKNNPVPAWPEHLLPER